VIGTMAVHGWAVTFGTARRGMPARRALPLSQNTARSWERCKLLNGSWRSPTSFDWFCYI